MIKVFGCECFPCLRAYVTHELEPHSTSYVFLGYGMNQKGFLCLNPVDGKVMVNRHVNFNEKLFPFSKFDELSAYVSDGSSSNFFIPYAIPIASILVSSFELSSTLLDNSFHCELSVTSSDHPNSLLIHEFYLSHILVFDNSYDKFSNGQNV